jgi:membrane protein DedA with SNARE-associated domain
VGEWLTDIVDWMSMLPMFWAYTMILVVSYTENIVPPIPGDMIIVYGGYMVGIGRLDVIPVVVLSTIGGLAGFMTMYLFGIHIGKRLVEGTGYRWIPVQRVERARTMLSRWGYHLILANRYLSGLRSVISLTVGMTGMPVGKTSWYATGSAFSWTCILVGLGYYLGDHWDQVSRYLKTYSSVVAIAIVSVVALQLYLGYRSRRSANSEAVSDQVERADLDEDPAG